MPVKLSYWLDREGIVHEGGQPRGPDDYRRTTCDERVVQHLHQAIGYTAPTCLLCMVRKR